MGAEQLDLTRKSHPLNPDDTANDSIRFSEAAMNPASGVSALEQQENWLREQLERFPPMESRIFPPQKRFGYMSKRQPVSPNNAPLNEWIELVLNENFPVKIDSLALIPAYYPGYSSEGNYGFPKRFKVDVYDHENPNTAVTVVDWTKKDFPDPGLYPVLFNMQGRAVKKIRLTVTRGAKEHGNEFFALDELMIFRGGVNIAPPLFHDLHVASTSAEAPFWHQQYLVDRKMHLGEFLHTYNKTKDFIQYFNTNPKPNKPPQIIIEKTKSSNTYTNEPPPSCWITKCTMARFIFQRRPLSPPDL